MIKIGVPVVISGDHWLGGLNYFKSLARVLNQYPDSDISVCFLTNNKAALSEANGASVSVVECDGLGDLSKAERIVNFITSTHWGLVKAAKKHKLDIITHTMPGRFMNLPTLYWMPDFQHCVLENIFTTKDKWSRNKCVKSSQRYGHILFSSHSSEDDFRKFYPRLKNVESHVLHFVPSINQNNSPLSSLDYLKNKYGVCDGYYYLPNQFWKHKNHQVVADALKLLPDNYQVISSGAIVDYRGDDHIIKLRNMLADFGLENRFKMLGVVPREDVYFLMEHALGVINPSFFEGWSTTVEEAKYSGKRLILSNLAVHLEQSPPDGLFFNPASATDLAEKMIQAKNEYDENSEQERRRIAKSAYAIASEKFAHDYITIIKDLLER